MAGAQFYTVVVGLCALAKFVGGRCLEAYSPPKFYSDIAGGSDRARAWSGRTATAMDWAEDNASYLTCLKRMNPKSPLACTYSCRLRGHSALSVLCVQYSNLSTVGSSLGCNLCKLGIRDTAGHGETSSPYGRHHVPQVVLSASSAVAGVTRVVNIETERH